jgi:putative FmdB family regulatory protein
MPIYEYKCLACGYEFEEIQKFSDPVINICPKCGGRVEKKISAPAVQFKGSGWYITDYAKKKSIKSSESSEKKVEEVKEKVKKENVVETHSHGV